MSFIDGFKKLAQPYDDDDDFFDEADESFKAPSLASEAQRRFENTFSSSAASEPEAQEEEDDPEESISEGPGLFGGFKRSKPKAGRQSAGGDQQIFLFSPKSIDDCGELANHILSARSVVLTLEGVPSDTARRMLDFMSGIAFALQGKITPVSSKTYFVTPQNVDIVGLGVPSAN